jgi:hypothetical protein
VTKPVKENDASTDRLLRRALHAEPGGQATPECADAETLAAWVDGALASAAVERLELHASGCARCQALLASMARTAPDPPARPWWQALTARWVVPVAAAATALVLWVAVDRERAARPAVPVSTAAADRAALPAAPEPVVTPEPVATPPVSSREPSAVDSVLAKRALDEAKAAGSSSSAPNRAEKPPAEVLADARAAKTAGAIAPQTDALGRNAAVAGRPDSLSTPPSAAPSPLAAPPPPSQPNAASAAAGGRSPVPSIPEPVSVAAETTALRASQVAVEHVDVMSPEPAYRWRLVAPATIQRSTDGGATWTAQSTRAPGFGLLQRTDSPQPAVILTAGAAPARDICWIVGRGGVVMLSTDGTSWQRRPFPEPVNLTAVRATDARTAVVTTQDGRQFSTADGGATWSRIP